MTARAGGAAPRCQRGRRHRAIGAAGGEWTHGRCTIDDATGRGALATVRAAGVGNVGVTDTGDLGSAVDPAWIQNSPVGRDEPRTRVDPGGGVPAVPVDRATVATAVGYTLQLLGGKSPGDAVEVRVPPYGAVRCIDGPFRPADVQPDLIETDAATWLRSPPVTCAGPTHVTAASCACREIAPTSTGTSRCCPFPEPTACRPPCTTARVAAAWGRMDAWRAHGSTTSRVRLRS